MSDDEMGVRGERNPREGGAKLFRKTLLERRHVTVTAELATSSCEVSKSSNDGTVDPWLSPKVCVLAVEKHLSEVEES